MDRPRETGADTLAHGEMTDAREDAVDQAFPTESGNRSRVTDRNREAKSVLVWFG